MNTIIEKIRAEVNRLWSEHPTEDIWDRGYNYACEEIMSFLSDLEKSEKPINPTIEKLRALIKMQIRREELNFASLGGGGQTMNIGALEWVLKQLDTLQEPINKWSNKERKARVKKTGEIVCGFTDGQGHFDIPTDHNEFIRYNLDELEFDTLQEQPGKHNALFDSCLAKVNPETREEVRKNIDKMIEQPVELDDAINNWQGIEAFPEGCGITPLPKAMEIVDKTARHFYALGQQSKQTEWTEEDIKNGSYISAFLQANCGDNVILKRATIWFMSRLKQLPIQQSKPEVSEGLYDFMKKRSESLYFHDDFEIAAYKKGVVDGAKWQKVAEAHAKDQPLGQDNDGNLVYLQEPPLWIRFAGGVYPVHATKELPGRIVAYEIEDTPGHFDLITNPEEVMTEQPVCEGEDEEYEQIKQKVCSDCPSHKDDYCGYVKRQLQRKCNYLSDVMYGYELGRQSKPTTAEGLEEEIQKYMSERWEFGCINPTTPVYLYDFTTDELKECARHFAKWGAEHLKK